MDALNTKSKDKDVGQGPQQDADAGEGFYMADRQGNISFASRAFAKMLRYAANEVLGLNMADKLYENRNDREDFLKKLRESGQVRDYSVKMVRKDGSRVVLSANSVLIVDENGEPVGVEGIVKEVTEETSGRKKERKIPELPSAAEVSGENFETAIKDPLTGLYNYQYFMTCLGAEVKRVERVFHPMAFMMIDLDNFKPYNDKHGRKEGDALLQKIAGILKGTLPTDILCRQAKDQFLAVLPETKKEEALALAKTLKDAIQSAMGDNGITCSIGLSRFILGMTVQEFFLQANVGLYMAKENGKNEACLYG